jgi:hypothetical protein
MLSVCAYYNLYANIKVNENISTAMQGIYRVENTAQVCPWFYATFLSYKIVMLLVLNNEMGHRSIHKSASCDQ